MTLDEELKIILEFEKINKGIISYSKTEKKKYKYLSPEHQKNLRNKLWRHRGYTTIIRHSSILQKKNIPMY